MIKEIGTQEREILEAWWDAHGVPHFPFALKRAYMVFDGKFPVCAGYCHVDDCKACGWIDYITMSPNATTEQREEGFIELMEKLESVLKEEGINFLIALANKPSLLARFSRAGFATADLDVVHMCKQL